MKKRWLVMAGVFGVAAAVISGFPLAWAGSSASAQMPNTVELRGTIWDGHVTGIPGIGPITLKADPKLMLTGKPFIAFKTQSPDFFAEGMAKPGHVEDVKANGNFRQLSAIDGRFSGLVGDFNLVVTEMRFGQNCQSATGSVSTDVLTRNHVRLQWTGPKLTGPVRCENGNVVLDLSGKDTQQSIKALMTVMPDGTYRAEVSVLTRDERAGVVLPLFGFQPKNNGFSLSEAGRWR